MKKLFALVLMSVLVGCASEVIPMYPTPDSAGTEDRVLVIADGSSDAQQPDASDEDATPEAAADVPIVRPDPVLSVRLLNPSSARQEMHQAFRYIELSAHAELVFRRMRFTIGTTETSRFVGSRGTHYLQNLTVTGSGPASQTLMGPIMVAPLTVNAFNAELTDSFVMHTGDVLMLAIRMDVSVVEDAPGELVGQSYAAIFIDGEGTRIFREGDVVRLQDQSVVRDEEIEGNRDMGGVPIRIEPTTYWPNQEGCYPIDWPTDPFDGHCSPGCFYLSDMLPYNVGRDPGRSRCIHVCAISGSLIGGDNSVDGMTGCTP